MINQEPQTNEQHEGYIGHSPGPWRWKPFQSGGFGVIDATSKFVLADGPDGLRVNWFGVMSKDINGASPNARLIAAAPDLLEACKDALYDSVDATTYPDGTCLNKHVRDALRAAIAKAEGVPTPQPASTTAPKESVIHE